MYWHRSTLLVTRLSSSDPFTKLHESFDLKFTNTIQVMAFRGFLRLGAYNQNASIRGFVLGGPRKLVSLI